ncbi:hypothetical protein ABIE40_003160 [Rhizobium sp. OAE497]
MTDAVQGGEKKSRSLKPLGRLTPYIMRYRGMVAGALVALALRRRHLSCPAARRPPDDRSRLHPA